MHHPTFNRHNNQYSHSIFSIYIKIARYINCTIKFLRRATVYAMRILTSYLSEHLDKYILNIQFHSYNQVCVKTA